MTEKETKNIDFDSRDLDESIVARLKQESEREAEMIANFNAKVNSKEHQAKVEQTNPYDNTEIGGPTGLEPTRYGDWERKGRCYDF